MPLEILVQRAGRAEIAHPAAQLAEHEAADPRPAALGVLVVDPVVADLRVGHRHDLAVVGRVGEDLLVTRHARVEDDLAVDLTTGAKGRSCEDCAVFQRELYDVHALARRPPRDGSAESPQHLVYAAAAAGV